jgi:hypothetical protein
MAPARSAVVGLELVTDAFITFIQTGISAPSTPRLVGDHEAPPGADLDIGYAVVYTIDGGQFEGASLWAPESEAEVVFQVTSVGRKRNQAQWIADRARLTVLSRLAAGGFQVAFPDPAGMTVTGREPEGSTPGVIPEGVAPNRVYNIPERYRLHVAVL